MSEKDDALDLFIADLTELGWHVRANTVRPGVPGEMFGTFFRTDEFDRVLAVARTRLVEMDDEDLQLAACLMTGAFCVLTAGKDLTAMSMAADMADAGLEG